jgi:hypothetical protein
MKICTYCGRKNKDSAHGCVECGTNDFKSDAAMAPTPAQAVEEPPPDLRLRDILTDQARLFRTLVIIGNGAFILTLIAPYVESHFLSFDTIELLNRNQEAALITLPGGISWLTTFLYLAIAVGLYQFSASARAAFVIFLVGFSVLGLFTGVSIVSPIVGFLGAVSLMTDGAILLLAYATPLKEKFE